MASTYTLNNGIQLMGTGDQSGLWGDTTNVNLQLIDTALDGQITVTLSSNGTTGTPNDLPITDGTAANSDGRNRLVIFEGTSVSAGNVYVRLTPSDAEKIVYIRNNLVAATNDLVLFQGVYSSSNDYLVKNGKTAIVYFDGSGSGAVAANVFDNAQIDALNVTGALDVGGALNALSTLDVTGTLDVVGNATFVEKITAKSIEIDGTSSTMLFDGVYPHGSNNVAFGQSSLNTSVSGGSNVAFGKSTLTSITTGYDNSAFGHQSQYLNLTGQRNTSFGTNTLYNNEGNGNVAIGYEAGKGYSAAVGLGTGGTDNVMIGSHAGEFKGTCYSNVLVGARAGLMIDQGERNTFLGHRAGEGAIGNLVPTFTGRDNVAIGYLSMQDTGGTSMFNTAVGSGALNKLGIDRDFNTAIGSNSGYWITTGEKNTILGSFDGNEARLDIRTLNNHVVLSDGDGLPVFWVDNNEDVYIPGVFSNTSGGAANVYVDSNGEMYRSTSSLRYKDNVEDSTHGLSEVMSLRSVTYTGKNNPEVVLGGLIAEEVHSAGLSEFVEYDGEGRPDALHYGNMVALCVKAIQELKTELDAANLKINELLEK